MKPAALFRICSITKPFTATAILQFEHEANSGSTIIPSTMLGLSPHLENGGAMDPRLRQITIRQLLHHTGGFDRDQSFDPMFRPVQIARALGVKPPAGPREIIRYMMGRPLDFDPGTRESYSNFGYCVLGRVIEKASGEDYGSTTFRSTSCVRWASSGCGSVIRWRRTPRRAKFTITPLGDPHIKSMFGDGRDVPIAYGGEDIEAMDVARRMDRLGTGIGAIRLGLRASGSLPSPKRKSIAEMFARPKDTGYESDGKPKAAYYADGWEVRPVRGGKANTWHAGQLDGISTLLVHRFDGLVWAVMFNRDYTKDHKVLAGLIDPMIHPVADGITDWPTGSAFDDRGE